MEGTVAQCINPLLCTGVLVEPWLFCFLLRLPEQQVRAKCLAFPTEAGDLG